jgi:hypothetical protein
MTVEMLSIYLVISPKKIAWSLLRATLAVLISSIFFINSIRDVMHSPDYIHYYVFWSMSVVAITLALLAFSIAASIFGKVRAISNSEAS